VGLTDAELAQRAGIDVAWLDEFKTGYASDKSRSPNASSTASA